VFSGRHTSLSTGLWASSASPLAWISNARTSEILGDVHPSSVSGLTITKALRIGGAMLPDLALLKQSQLLPQKQVLGRQRTTGLSD
jgi:hypothetical protein